MGGNKERRYGEGAVYGISEFANPQSQRSGNGYNAEQPGNKGPQVYKYAGQQKAGNDTGGRQYRHQPFQMPIYGIRILGCRMP
jgi:hypothetical protein